MDGGGSGLPKGGLQCSPNKNSNWIEMENDFHCIKLFHYVRSVVAEEGIDLSLRAGTTQGIMALIAPWLLVEPVVRA